MGALLTQFMNRYAYTDFHELNADWMIRTMMELINQVENFVSLNAIKYADPIQWNITSQYEKNTIVIDPLSGTAYISVQAVPMGVALTNTDYWTVVFDLGSFVVRAAKNFTNRYEADTTLTATFASTQGDWLVWGDVLYEVIIPIINAGDQYVVDSNIRHITMEEVVDALAQAIDAVDTKVGDLNDLQTSVTTSVVDAINSVLNDLNITIGDLTQLQTIDTTSIVAAINSNKTQIDNMKIFNIVDYGAVGDGVTDSSSAILSALTDAMAAHGILYIPAGVFRSNPLTLSARVSIIGEGDHQSILKPINLTSSFITCTAFGINIRDIQILYDVQPTGGYAIELNGPTENVSNVAIYYPYKGILMNDNGGILQDITIQGHVDYPIYRGIDVQGGDSSQIIDNCILKQENSGASQGITISNNAALCVSNLRIIGFSNNMKIDNSVGPVYSLKVVNSFFDQSTGDNILISGSSAIRLSFEHCWISDAGASGISLVSTGAMTFNVYDCDIAINGTCGINIYGPVHGTVHNCLIAGNITGINIQSVSVTLDVIGNVFRGDGHGPNQYGIYSANGAETLTLLSNDLEFQTVANVAALNQSLGTKNIKGNAGYNAIGDMRYNTVTTQTEYWNGSAWTNV